MPIYWAFLTYMLLKPGVENHEYWFMFTGIDKLVHLSIFAALGFAYRCRFPRQIFAKFMLVMLIYAFLTENLQDAMGLGRSAEAMDIVADTVGVLIGWQFFRLLRNYFK